MAGFPKPAHIPKREPDAEEIPTDPKAIPPFRPQGLGGELFVSDEGSTIFFEGVNFSKEYIF